jgi:hypothetical protein
MLCFLLCVLKDTKDHCGCSILLYRSLYYGCVAQKYSNLITLSAVDVAVVALVCSYARKFTGKIKVGSTATHIV